MSYSLLTPAEQEYPFRHHLSWVGSDNILHWDHYFVELGLERLPLGKLSYLIKNFWSYVIWKWDRILYFWSFRPVVEYGNRPRRPRNNLMWVNTTPKLKCPMRSASWHHLSCVGSKTAWERQRGSRLFSPSLALLRTYNNFQAIKEVIKTHQA